MTAEEIFNMFFGGGMPGSSGTQQLEVSNNKKGEGEHLVINAQMALRIRISL